jgi:hypothetical protein
MPGQVLYGLQSLPLPLPLPPPLLLPPLLLLLLQLHRRSD